MPMGTGAPGRGGRAIAAAGAACVALAGALVFVPGCKVEHETHVPIGTITRTEYPGAATRLYVRGLVGDVHVKPSKDDRITVRATVYVREAMHASFSKPDLSRDVRIEVDDEDFVVESRHIEPPTGAEWRIDFDIEAPTDLDWRVSTIQRGIHLEPDGNDVSADVELGDILVTGRPNHVRLESKLGEVSVDVKGIGGGSLRADSDDVKLVVK